MVILNRVKKLHCKHFISVIQNQHLSRQVARMSSLESTSTSFSDRVSTMWHRIVGFVISQIICIPFVRVPFQNVDNPSSHGMVNSVNLRIPVPNSDKKEELGAWYCKPVAPLEGEASEEGQAEADNKENLIKENEVAILYLHGNAATRAQKHRRLLYKIFQKLGYHVLAIDYRGYSDSSWIAPTETTLVQDAKTAYDWLKSKSHESSRIFVWGHSLGTGVTSHFAKMMAESENPKPQGYFLEAPFNRMTDEVMSFRMARLLTYLRLNVNKVLTMSDMSFDSEESLKSVTLPIQIYHAEDDGTIPVELARKMVHSLKENGNNVHYKEFPKNLRLGHDDIYKASDLPESIEQFVREAVTKN